MATVDLQSTNERGMLYYDHQLIKGQLDGLDTSDSINDKLNTQQTYTDNYGLLGEIRQIALSITGALTKSQLQARGWAICDGTTPVAQGITSPTIVTTPNLKEKFLRHSADETTGGTGGSETHNHQWWKGPINKRGTWESDGTTEESGFTKRTSSFPSDSGDYIITNLNDYDGYTKNTETIPPYYDVVYFIKVK